MFSLVVSDYIIYLCYVILFAFVFLFHNESCRPFWFSTVLSASLSESNFTPDLSNAPNTGKCNFLKESILTVLSSYQLSVKRTEIQTLI
ncbi:hypothetical protein SKAU_G00181940 [Synaphobranchus kaupii]|uniref:Uncharacterized protein n=1 Tax=Synaphobranchus kaupii TaxID=118154 RepID=A0A9Q1FCB8_SYNKA|nr:hypothetical protein SKAU_G00181940 [Synaphobranchus kaupii]